MEDYIVDLLKENQQDIRDIKDNHLVGIYKALWQIRGTLVVLVPLVLAILALAIIGVSNGS